MFYKETNTSSTTRFKGETEGDVQSNNVLNKYKLSNKILYNNLKNSNH